MVIDLAVQLQGKVKDNTPVKTGHLRNEWHVGSIEKRGNVLHYSFTINFRQAREQTNEFEPMGELEVAIRKGV